MKTVYITKNMRNNLFLTLFLFNCYTFAAKSESFTNYIETVNNLNIEMIAVQGGTFTMGCTPEQGDDCLDDERPTHRVTISDFYIGKYEVTQALWTVVMGNNPSGFKGDNLPVERVNWEEVQQFIVKLNALTGKQYRLPTEAEWEYAARGGNKSKGYKYSGSNDVDSVAWHTGNSDNKTHAVGLKLPNELGIYDMSGNVWEWCNDSRRKYDSNEQTNPQGDLTDFTRVYRGGSWYGIANLSRVSFRYFNRIVSYYHFVGFRLALSAK